MKKFVLFLLATLSTLAIAGGCNMGGGTSEETSSPIDSSVASSESASTASEETSTEEPLPTGDIVYPEGFSVGYNRQDISPTELPIISLTSTTPSIMAPGF